MKITSVDVIKLKRLAFSAQTPVLCRINTDGYGEAGVSIMDFSVGSYELLKLFSPMLIGKDPMDHEVIYSQLAGSFWAEGNGGVIMAAISAIDTALWDIKGKALGVPVYKLLGGTGQLYERDLSQHSFQRIRLWRSDYLRHRQSVWNRLYCQAAERTLRYPHIRTFAVRHLRYPQRPAGILSTFSSQDISPTGPTASGRPS